MDGIIELYKEIKDVFSPHVLFDLFFAVFLFLFSFFFFFDFPPFMVGEGVEDGYCLLGVCRREMSFSLLVVIKVVVVCVPYWYFEASPISQSILPVINDETLSFLASPAGRSPTAASAGAIHHLPERLCKVRLKTRNP